MQTEGGAQALVECEMQSAVDRMAGGPVAQAYAARIVVSGLRVIPIPKVRVSQKSVLCTLGTPPQSSVFVLARGTPISAHVFSAIGTNKHN